MATKNLPEQSIAGRVSTRTKQCIDDLPLRLHIPARSRQLHREDRVQRVVPAQQTDTASEHPRQDQ